MYKQKVWDLPVRVCHWGFVVIIVFQYLSAEVFDDEILPNTLQWHMNVGLACIGLLVFRICWGLFGSYYAKFSQFLVTPSTAFAYLTNKNSSEAFVGHNPAGAYSVVVMLSLIMTQAVSGLFISDDIFTQGPYYGVLSGIGQKIMNLLHHNIFIVLFGFIGLHIITIIIYKLKFKEALTKAMVTGNKELQGPQNVNIAFPWGGFVISILITALTMYLLIEVLPPIPVEEY